MFHAKYKKNSQNIRIVKKKFVNQEELGFVCHQTPKKQLYENGMPKKGLDGALSTTKH